MIAPPQSPRPDELEALIREARARQLRRRLVGTAGIAAAAALTLGLYALTTGGNPGNLGQPAAKGGRATGPLCRASQLSVTATFQGATQSMLGGVYVTNTSGSACSLPQRRPQVRIVWHGKAVPAREDGPPGSLYGDPWWRPARVLAPDARAEVVMQWLQSWSVCSAAIPNFKPVIDMRFPGGPAVAATATMMAPVCDLHRQTLLGVSRPLTEP